MPVEITFKSLAESLENPLKGPGDALYISDYSKMERPNQLHVGLIALLKFHEKYGKLPELNNQAQAQEVIEMAKVINAERKTVFKYR